MVTCIAMLLLSCYVARGVFPSTCMLVYGFKWPLGIVFLLGAVKWIICCRYYILVLKTGFGGGWLYVWRQGVCSVVGSHINPLKLLSECRFRVYYRDHNIICI